MIEKIVIENFMSHTNSTIELGPTTNAIVGKNDSGKSAIFHAIRWLTLDNPKGESVITEGHDLCKVTLYTNAGVVSKQRKRNGGTSWETLVSSTKAKNSYNTAAQPPELEHIIKLSDVSFSMQHDTPYLIGSSGSDAAELLGSVSGVDVIDTAIDIVAKQLNGASSILKMQESALKSAENKVALLSAVKDIKSRFLRVIEHEKFNSLKGIDHQSFVNLLDKDKELTRQLVKHDSYYRLLSNVSLLSQAFEYNEGLRLKVEKLDAIMAHFTALEKALLFSQEELTALRSLRDSSTENIEAEYTTLVALKANLKRLRAIEANAVKSELEASTLAATNELLEAVEKLTLQKHRVFVEIKEKMYKTEVLKSSINQVASKLSNIEKLVGSASDLGKMAEAKEVLKELRNEYSKANAIVIGLNAKLAEASSNISRIHSKLETLNGQICPTCGGELKLV